MAKSGIMPEVLGNHDGTDDLRMRDLPDIVIHQGDAKYIRTPNRITVRLELSGRNAVLFECVDNGTHTCIYRQHKFV